MSVLTMYTSELAMLCHVGWQARGNCEERSRTVGKTGVGLLTTAAWSSLWVLSGMAKRQHLLLYTWLSHCCMFWIQYRPLFIMHLAFRIIHIINHLPKYELCAFPICLKVYYTRKEKFFWNFYWHSMQDSNNIYNSWWFWYLFTDFEHYVVVKTVGVIDYRKK